MFYIRYWMQCSCASVCAKIKVKKKYRNLDRKMKHKGWKIKKTIINIFYNWKRVKCIHVTSANMQTRPRTYRGQSSPACRPDDWSFYLFHCFYLFHYVLIFLIFGNIWAYSHMWFFFPFMFSFLLYFLKTKI